MICAWCNGGDDDGSGSHGICEECKQQMLLQSAIRSYNKTPSYVETQATLFAQECEEYLSEQAVVA